MTDSSHLLATVNLVLGGLVFLLGFVILRENPRQRLNRVVSLMLFFGGFGAVLAVGLVAELVWALARSTPRSTPST